MNRPTVESVVRLAILPAVLLLMTLFAPVYPAHAQAVPPRPNWPMPSIRTRTSNPPAATSAFICWKAFWGRWSAGFA